MAERKPISKRLRFEIFKRDEFKCQYCGITPPAGILEIDHITPVSKGGNNRSENLITACFDCNRGKSDVLLSSLPSTVNQKADLIAEKLAQLKAYERLIKSKRKHEEKQIDEVEETFRIYFNGYSFTPKFRQSVRTFVRNIPTHIVVDSMSIAGSKISDPDRTIKYFCGICWRLIRKSKEENSHGFEGWDADAK